jgi:hypothetical protein
MMQDKSNIQAYRILEQYSLGALTIEEALEAYGEIEKNIDIKVANMVRRILYACHNEEITKDLPQTD